MSRDQRQRTVYRRTTTSLIMVLQELEKSRTIVDAATKRHGEEVGGKVISCNRLLTRRIRSNAERMHAWRVYTCDQCGGEGISGFHRTIEQRCRPSYRLGIVVCTGVDWRVNQPAGATIGLRIFHAVAHFTRISHVM